MNIKAKLKKVKRKVLFYKLTTERARGYHGDHDAKGNKESTPPASEKLELHSVWVTEAFPPSKLDALITSIKKMGWEYSERDISRKTTLTEWISKNRSSIGGGSWINGGTILNKRDDKFAFDARKTNLPEGVDYGYLTLRNITASLTLVTMQFVLKDEESLKINEVFDREFKTKVKYYPSLWNAKNAVYIDVKKQKEDAIQKSIKATHYKLHSWFKQNIPGYFASSNETQNSLPTVSLITSNIYSSSENKKRHYKDYLDFILRGKQVWTCNDIKDLEMLLSNDSSEISLFGNYNKLVKDNDVYGGKDRAGLVNKLHQHIDLTIDLWALHQVIHTYKEKLSKIRDKNEKRIKGTKATLENLEYTRDEFLSISSDFQTLSSDIKEILKSKRYYSTDAVDFSPPLSYRKIYSSFLELIREQDQYMLERIEKLEILLNQSIIMRGNLASAIANIKIQNSVFWWTITIGVITVIGIVFDIYTRIFWGD